MEDHSKHTTIDKMRLAKRFSVSIGSCQCFQPKFNIMHRNACHTINQPIKIDVMYYSPQWSMKEKCCQQLCQMMMDLTYQIPQSHILVPAM